MLPSEGPGKQLRVERLNVQLVLLYML
jgi:hypothetical protein